jgi:hypothetical protein
MLTRLIVASYAWFLEVALWGSLALAGIAGYNATLPIFDTLGAIPSPEFAWKIFGACAFVIGAFLLLAVITGPFLILMDIRHAVRSIEAKIVSGESAEGVRPIERREPTP